MILQKGHQLEYLIKLKNGQIPQGYGVNCDLDKNLRFKRSHFNIFLGHDNVGKSYFISWYMLTLSMIHGLKWIIWSGENQPAKIVRDMIQMLSGQKFMDLTEKEIISYSTIIDQHFDFLSNKQLYKPDELLKIFDDADVDGCLIDPFTGLDRGMSWEENYRFLNKARQFCNMTGKTIYLCTHPNTESGRSGNVYEKKHPFAGHLRAPMKDAIEGGKAFTNRTDDVIVIHRLTKHPQLRYTTMVSIDKVKDTDTGGEQTMLDDPIHFDYNFGLGFKINGVDPLAPYRKRKEIITNLQSKIYGTNG
jgi:hypothetical protein